MKADNLTAFINHFELNENEKRKMLLIVRKFYHAIGLYHAELPKNPKCCYETNGTV
jgi:hypothetical protein